MPFVVTDVETTGTQAETQRVIEIGAVRVLGGQLVDSFQTLIHPQQHVPSRITQITGISDAMLFGQPLIREVLPDYLGFLGEGIFVAHNAPFDRRFLDAELLRNGFDALDNPVLCTLRLARRLLPPAARKGLSHLADYYGIMVQGRHRALGDAEATARLLLRLTQQARAEFGIETLGQLLRFQHRKYADTRKTPPNVARIRREVLPKLPARPGVYFMKDHRGSIIYVGKAKALRNRVSSYFNGLETNDEKTKKLVHAVRDVAWRETNSEVEALLLETRLIVELQPRFNRAQRRYRAYGFLRLDTKHRFPDVSLSFRIENDGAEYFGPVGRRQRAEELLELIHRLFRLRECDENTLAIRRACLYSEIGRCTAPCADPDAADRYEEEVQKVRAFLTGQNTEVFALIEQAMREAAAVLDFEQARFYRDQLRSLEKVLARQQQIAVPVLAHHAVVAQAGAEPGTTILLFVRFGRLAGSFVLPDTPSPEKINALRDALALHFDAAQTPPERYLRPEVEEVRMLSSWLYRNQGSLRTLRWHPDCPPEAFAETVMEMAPLGVGPQREGVEEGWTASS